MMSCVSNSYEEPLAIWRYRAKSLFVDLPAPSAMFELIEIAERRICEIKPYFSDLGKHEVNLYTSVAKATDLFQTESSL